MAGLEPVSSNNLMAGYIPQNNKSKEVTTKPIEVKKRTFTASEVSAAVLATALAATTIGGAVLYGRYRGVKGKTAELEKNLSKLVDSQTSTTTRMQELERNLTSAIGEKGQLEAKAQKLEESLNSALEEKGKLETKTQELQENLNIVLEEKDQLQNKTLELETQIKTLIEGQSYDDEEIGPILANLKSQLAEAKLDYDIESPHIVRKMAKSFDDMVDLPDYRGTTNRANMEVLKIPEIDDGRFEITLPMSKEAIISHPQSKDFTPEFNVRTNLSEDYADSVNWNSDKIARDILQNFYDGHGQTLDGVSIKIVPTKNGKFRVRIEGKTTYTQDKAILIGESSKRNNANAAGNYGEGIKMASLKLLRDCGANDVVIASDNWKLNYSLQKGNITDKKVLTYSINKETKPYDGNYLEFETDNVELLKSIRNTINRFYHSGNEHFKCPDFENELFGLKLLDKGETGALYIAGQRFEYKDNYDGLKELVLFIKEKPPVDVLDPSRDRTSLDSQDFRKIVRWLIKDSKKMTKEERLQLIKVFESRWDSSPFESDAGLFLDNLLDTESLLRDTLHINFPEKYVAYSRCDDSILEKIKQNGYTVCKAKFVNLGMKNIADLYGEARKHNPLKPTEIQEKRILILKNALNKLSEAMKKHGFADSEIDARIHLFDRQASNEIFYRNTLAEAIVENYTSKGFWIDTNYILDNSFGHVLETSLHELSHKVGGDSSSEFSYKLTDVNAEVLETLLENPKLRKELQALSLLWDEVV